MISSHRPSSVSGRNAGTRTVNSSIGPVTRSPTRAIASTCSPATSTIVMSAPARARYAPSVPPIAPAPQTSDRLIATSGRLAPWARQQRARLLYRDLPQREHVLVRALVASAEIAVAEVAAQRHRVERTHARQIHHLAGGVRHRDA